MNKETVYSAEFDSHPGRIGKVDVVCTNDIDRLFVQIGDGEPVLLLNCDRDQWGVYLSVSGGVMVAQQDKTRSYIDAMIGALQFLRMRNECETMTATVSSNP